MPRNEVSQETLAKLSKFETAEYWRMMHDPWYLQLPLPIQEAVKRYPPFYIYRLKSTDQLVRIIEYNEKKDDLDFPITFKVLIDPDFNKDAATPFYEVSGKQIELNRAIFGVPAADLEHVMLRALALAERVTAQAKSMQNVIPMEARATALRKSRKIRTERTIENIMRDNRKKKATDFAIDGIKKSPAPDSST